MLIVGGGSINEVFEGVAGDYWTTRQRALLAVGFRCSGPALGHISLFKPE